MSTDLGPRPDPEIEPGEPNPGGVDAVDGGDQEGAPTGHDLATDSNPALDATPAETKTGEDTSTQATRDADDPIKPEEESPA